MLSVGERKWKLPGKRKFLVHLAWDHRENRPEAVAEDAKRKFRYPVTIKDGKIEILKGNARELSKSVAGEGKKIEVIYDVIDLILSEKPDANIFKLKKTCPSGRRA
jgi:hypothetical protein